MDRPNELVLEFLEWYENERNEVYDAWKRIALNMGQKYTVPDFKKKESLMASFRTCLNKVKQSTKSGAGTGDVYKPHWFAYEKMNSFLRNKDEPKNTINTEDILSDEGCDNKELEEDIADVNSKTEELERDDVQNDALVLPSGSKTVFQTPLRKKKKNAEVDELKDKMNNAYSILQDAVKKPAKEKSVCTIYGELVATKIQLMDERIRDICMHRIDNILFEMKMNPGVNTSSSPISPQSLSSFSNHTFSFPSHSPSPHQTLSSRQSMQNVTIDSDTPGDNMDPESLTVYFANYQ